MPTQPRRPTLLTVAFGLVGLACSDDHGHTPADSNGSGAAAAIEASQRITCHNKPGVTAWASKLAVKGTSTQVIFEAVQPPGTSAPGDLAPTVGDNTFVVSVKDAAGTDLPDGTMVNLVSTMPEHSHPPPPAVQAKVAGGKATLPTVKLFMAGLWQLTFEVTPAGKAADRPTVSLCLDG